MVANLTKNKPRKPNFAKSTAFVTWYKKPVTNGVWCIGLEQTIIYRNWHYGKRSTQQLYSFARGSWHTLQYLAVGLVYTICQIMLDARSSVRVRRTLKWPCAMLQHITPARSIAHRPRKTWACLSSHGPGCTM